MKTGALTGLWVLLRSPSAMLGGLRRESHPLRLAHRWVLLRSALEADLRRERVALRESHPLHAYLHTVEDEVRVVVRRPIQAGEGLTIDYLVNTHGGSSWRCRCGADRCHGRLETSFCQLPTRFQREYLPLPKVWFVEEPLLAGDEHLYTLGSLPPGPWTLNVYEWQRGAMQGACAANRTPVTARNRGRSR